MALEWDAGHGGPSQGLVVAPNRFMVPPPPPGLVVRERLTAVLANTTARVTLVVGTPGAGKTTAISSWVATRAGTTAWLSCDSLDADPLRFWTALAVAIRHAVPRAGERALELLELDGAESVDAAASLASDCELAPGLVIVLDDFHFARLATEATVAFVSALPRDVRLVLGSREELAMPTARLRVAGQLMEIRDDDLRFRLGETAEFLGCLGIDLPPGDVERIWTLTEGWAAGLQLAAVSLRARPDVDALLDAFATSHRGVSDFLVNEVIDLQPDEVTEFLFSTSVLESFDAGLCDEVTRRGDSARILEDLHQRHLFLVVLDERSGRYRYHHLFAAFLQARLRSSAPTAFPQAHTTASRACAARGDVLGALRHAVAAKDTDLAMQLVRSSARETSDVASRELSIDTVRTWLRLHGEDAIAADPQLVLECTVILVALAALDDAEPWLERLEGRLAELDPIDQAFLVGQWGFAALHRGDAGRASDLSQRAMAMAGPEMAGHVWLRQTPIIECHAQLLIGDTAAARRAVEHARSLRLPPTVVGEVRFPGILAYAALLEGELVEARRHAERALEIARSMQLDDDNIALVLPGLVLGAIGREEDDLDRAAQAIDNCSLAASAARRPPFEMWCALERARLHLTSGDIDCLLTTLDEARMIMPAATPMVTDALDRLEARAAIETKDHRAPDLVRELLPSVDRDLLEARLAVAAGDESTAQAALGRIVPTTIRHELEHHLLMARATVSRDWPAALASIDAAVRTARRNGMVRAVLDEGPDVLALVEALPTDARTGRFVEQVLGAAHGRPRHEPQRSVRAPVMSAEVLSQRELDVLRFLDSRLTYAEIATRLYISVNTLKSHVKAVYRKLGASTRSQAVAAARVRGLT